jgi:hypothetical protein
VNHGSGGRASDWSASRSAFWPGSFDDDGRPPPWVLVFLGAALSFCLGGRQLHPRQRPVCQPLPAVQRDPLDPDCAELFRPVHLSSRQTAAMLLVALIALVEPERAPGWLRAHARTLRIRRPRQTVPEKSSSGARQTSARRAGPPLAHRHPCAAPAPARGRPEGRSRGGGSRRA